jgi:transcriptional regulator with XRE-family HTH domain
VTDQEEALFALGDRLRRLRQTTGLSQNQVGFRIGLTGSSVGSMERGHYGALAMPTVVKLAAALGYTVAELLGDTGYEPPVRSVYPHGHGMRNRVPEAARAPRPDQVHPLVQELRRERQKTMSQVAMARKLGVSGPTINNWEYGLSQVTVWNLAEWADALGYELKLIPKEVED